MRYSWLFTVSAAALTVGCGFLDPVLDEPSDLTGTCVVETTDVETQILSSRLEFADVGLVRGTWRWSPNSFAIRANRFDGRGLLRSATHFERHVVDDSPRVKRTNQPQFQHDNEKRVVMSFEHDELGNLSRRLVVSRFQDATISSSIMSEYLYQWDQQGRKVRQQQDYVSDNGHVSTAIHEYEYEGERLVAQTRRTVGFLESRTTFQYDSVGRWIGTHHVSRRLAAPVETEWMRPYSSRRVFDERGRLTGIGVGHSYDYDDRDRLARAHDVVYTYDDGGRLASARRPDGTGQDLRYSPECPHDFAHPTITPTADHPYNGHAQRHEWVSY